MSVYEKHRHVDARLPVILHDYSFPEGVDACYGNWHENVELLFCMEGSCVVTSNELRIPLGAGELAVINSSRIHTVFSTAPLRYFVIIVDRDFCLANHFDTSAVTFTPYVSDPEITAVIRDIVSEHTALRADAHGIPLLRARILTVMALLLHRHATGDGSARRDNALIAAIKRVLGHIHSSYASPLTLDGLSEVAGLSRYYLAREFRRMIGMTPIAYVNEVRCDRAKRLLAEGEMTVEGIAAACGFSGSSYFARIFRSVEGRSPGAYREAILGKRMPRTDKNVSKTLHKGESHEMRSS